MSAVERAAGQGTARDVLAGVSWRVTRGNPTAEELAALAVVLAVRMRAAGGEEEAGARLSAARWEDGPGRPSRAWSARPLPGWRSAA